MSFALFCKTFRRDVGRFSVLLASVERFNESRLPFFVCVPRDDLALFRERFGERVSWLVDEEVVGGSLQQGWVTQQLVKLCAGLTGFADAWILLDADFYFVRPFFLSDFVDGEGRVAFVASRAMHMLDHLGVRVFEHLQGMQTGDVPSCAELTSGFLGEVAKLGLVRRLADRFRSPIANAVSRRPQEFFGYEGPSFSFMPGPVWTRESIVGLERELRGLPFRSMLRHAPWEAHWVAMHAMRSGLKNRFIAGPYFLHIASDEWLEAARKMRLSEALVAQRYLGLALAAGHQSDEKL
jgi:Family of unknown function (DUF6492)